jgi:hypothetical protein
MKKFAIVGPDNKALNFIEWDEQQQFDYGQAQGNFLVSLDGVESYGFDWTWNGSSFVEPVASPIVPESITRRQCALQLLAIAQITTQEALNMTKTAAVPDAIAAVFDAQVASGAWTTDQRILAEIDFAADNYYRSNSLLGLMGLTEQELDAFFIAAAQL